MRAAIYKKYGAPEVVQILEVKKPIPKNNEVLIKIYASTINSADWRLRSLEVPKGYGVLVRLAMGIFGPRNKILGMELAGVIEEIGKDVRKFKVGDEVFASCMFGAHAQYRVLKEDAAIALKPDNLSFEEASALSFGGSTALLFLKTLGDIKIGEKLLINGASGAVGVAAIQLAKYFGAEVTAVCSGANAELVKSLGAEKVIDYQKEDFSKNGQTYDLIMDNVGNASWSRVKNSLNETGRLLLVVAGLLEMIKAAFVSNKNGKRVLTGTPKDKSKDLQFLAELVEKGKYKPHIDNIYSLEEIVAAHSYVDSGRKRGSVVITMLPSKLTMTI